MLSDIQNFNFEIKYNKKTNTKENNKYSNIFIYNNMSSTPLEKYRVKLNNISVIDLYTYNNNKEDVSALKLLLCPLTRNLLENILYIDRVETHLIKLLNTKYNKNIKFKRNFRDITDYYPSIIANIPSVKKGKTFIHDTNVYDIFRNRKNISDIKKFSNVTVILELSNVWTKNDEIGGFSWEIRCLKLYDGLSIVDNQLFEDNTNIDYRIINNFNKLSDMFDIIDSIGLDLIEF